MIALLQWPAMVITIMAAWTITSENKSRRNTGFWLSLVGNFLWIVWALSERADAVVVLNIILAITSIRGAIKTAHAAKNKM